MSYSTTQVTRHKDVIELESQSTNSQKLKADRKKDANKARNELVKKAAEVANLPGMDVLVIMRKKWPTGQEHWISNSIRGKEDQWDLNLAAYVQRCQPPIRPLDPHQRKIVLMNRVSKAGSGIVKQISEAVKQTSGTVKQSSTSGPAKRSAIVKSPSVGAARRRKLAKISTKFRGFPAPPQVATSPAIL